MSIVKSSYPGRARRTAFGLWSGSDYMVNQDDEHSWSGFPVLRLAMRKDTDPRLEIEARTAYVSLTGEYEPNAVLRAVYWDSRTLLGKSRDDPGPVKVPARFVQIPVSLVDQWLRLFDAIQTPIHVFELPGRDLPICSLRIETNYVNSVFEMIWQVPPGEPNELTRAWLEVWHSMGSALQTCPQVTGLEESFPCVEGKPEAYDFQAYEPMLTLP